MKVKMSPVVFLILAVAVVAALPFACSGSASGPPTSGPATQLSLSSGDGQTGPVNATLANPLKVKAADQFGNGVSGVGVTWQVTSGSATVNPMSSTSDATGLAQTTVTLGGTAGPITITATSTGLTGSPVTFHATATTLPTTAAVTVGNLFFQSVHNGSQNPAVDTVMAGGTVTWTWNESGISHGVESTGLPMFTSETGTQSTSGATYKVTFTSPGRYTYICSVHPTIMSGTVVVR